MATIRKRGSKWQAQIRRLGHRPITKTLLTRDDALRWSRAEERRLDLGETIHTQSAEKQLQTLTDLIARYEREVSCHKRSKSEEFHFRQMIRHSIGKLSIAKLTPSAVAGYRDHRLKTVSGSTVRKELALLGHVLKIARNEWGVPHLGDPVKPVAKPSPSRGRDRRLSPEEVTTIQQSLQRMRNPLIKETFAFALATGMRRGEVLSLLWLHVDTANKTALLPMTKNGNKRTVPLSPEALAVLDRLAKTRQSGTEDTPLPLNGRVFPLTPNAVRLAWDRMTKRAKIKDLRFHDLRHEAISRFFEMGLSVPEVALISGHKDTRMLFRYTHLRAEDIANKLTVLKKKINYDIMA